MECTEFEEKAYEQWLWRWLRHDIGLEILPDESYRGPWLKRARENLFLTAGDVASRLKISQQAYSNLEASEEKGRISILKLKQAAEAMDCDLTYRFTPKSGKTFRRMIWEKTLAKARTLPFYKNGLQSPNKLVMFMVLLVRDTDMRKVMGWNQRGKTYSYDATNRYIDRWWGRWQGIK